MTVSERLRELCVHAETAAHHAAQAGIEVAKAGEAHRRTDAALKDATRHCLNLQAEALRRYEVLGIALAHSVLLPPPEQPPVSQTEPAEAGGAGW